MFVPPAIVKVSDCVLAVVDPVSPATDAQRLSEEIPESSLAGAHLLEVEFHFKT